MANYDSFGVEIKKMQELEKKLKYELEKRNSLIADLIVNGYCGLTFSEVETMSKDDLIVLVNALKEAQGRKNRKTNGLARQFNGSGTEPY